MDILSGVLFATLDLELLGIGSAYSSDFSTYPPRPHEYIAPCTLYIAVDHRRQQEPSWGHDSYLVMELRLSFWPLSTRVLFVAR